MTVELKTDEMKNRRQKEARKQRYRDGTRDMRQWRTYNLKYVTHNPIVYHKSRNPIFRIKLNKPFHNCRIKVRQNTATIIKGIIREREKY